ncbi:AAA family ATPase [Teredinibacter turnerae]|uniref:AAA family ATPase n=1 Tax=Teredinibacter turnerae TaxID=2426 RepID=UPI0003768109|nr:AAA family ATPase [Teredinibacter turnerae]
MKLQIDRPFVEAMVSEFEELGFLAEQLKFGNRAEATLQRFTAQHMDYLKQLYTDYGPSMMGHVAHISTLQRAMCANDEKFGKGDLEKLVPAVSAFLTENAQRGWMFKINTAGKALAYLVTRIDFTPPGEEESGRLLIELKTNSLGKIQTVNISILDKDIEGKSIAEIFAEKGFLRETPELLDAYDTSSEKYFRWRSAYGKQFLAQGTGIFAEDPSASHRNQDWSRKSVVVLSSSGSAAKLVNDEEILQNRELTLDAPGNILAKYLRKAGRSVNFSDKVEKATEAVANAIPDTLFTELPVHGYVLMFHLDLHHHLWVHVDDMQEYIYQPELKDKLVLPPEQTDLIDILTAEMDMLMDDIVEGKSGGTTVLCAGPAGVGKTLTAEVYSEIIRRPLYRVHSGQLGLNVTEMEKALKDTLTRAQRWGAVMLIDEADVYIKRRDDNIAANAVVGVFLRVLEYFNGLLFLTTNRVHDIDEAIVSRCIALIKYHPPELEDRERIWQVMSDQFALNLSGSLVHDLAERFPQACGRDIKGLAKLVAKYCQYKSVSPDMTVFERCCIFRGLEAKTPHG